MIWLSQHRLRVGVIAATVLCARIAAAGGDAAGSLGTGGTATGDISRTDGETDRISIDVIDGTTLAVALKATFNATIAMTDPDGVPVALSLAGSGTERGSIEIAHGGTFQIAIASADGSQGLYKLTVKQTVPRTIDVAGTGNDTVEFGMLAGGKVSCTIAPAPGSSGSPQIAQLADPNGADLLTAPVVVRGRAAKLTPTTAAVAGTYRLTIADDAGSAWTGHLVRRAPRGHGVSLRLANGIDAVSFRGDGVNAVFSRHCASCHGWASSYSGVRRYAFDAIARMTKGIMPPGGGLSSAEIALVKTWISTGRQP
jgi:mono/diheme cytochrome c family protein